MNPSKTTHIHAIRHCRTNRYHWLCDNVRQNSDTCYPTLSAHQYQWSPAKHYNCWIPFRSVHADDLSRCEPVVTNWCPPLSNTVTDTMKSNGIHQLVKGYLSHNFLEYDWSSCHYISNIQTTGPHSLLCPENILQHTFPIILLLSILFIIAFMKFTLALEGVFGYGSSWIGPILDIQIYTNNYTTTQVIGSIWPFCNGLSNTL